jgi:hypothetical protein
MAALTSLLAATLPASRTKVFIKIAYCLAGYRENKQCVACIIYIIKPIIYVIIDGGYLLSM